MTRIVVEQHPAWKGRWWTWQLLDADTGRQLDYGRTTTQTVANAEAVEAQEAYDRRLIDGDPTAEMTVEVWDRR